MNETTESNEPVQETATPEPAPSAGDEKKAKLGLIALVIYVALLALGTIGELFDVEWILDLPLFRPPGKY